MAREFVFDNHLRDHRDQLRVVRAGHPQLDEADVSGAGLRVPVRRNGPVRAAP